MKKKKKKNISIIINRLKVDTSSLLDQRTKIFK